MAITALSYLVMLTLRQQKVLAPGTQMIEMGASNWYGDVSLEQLAQDVNTLETDEPRRAEFLRVLQDHGGQDARAFAFKLADVFFRGIAGCASVVSVDPGEPTSDYKFNLNDPLPLDGQTFDLVINYGTGEHIFDVRQFYKTIHDLTKPGGLMIHTAPMTGWVDHGFYNVQPTLFMDLATANHYDVLVAVVGELNPLRVTQLTSREHVTELAKNGQLPANALIEVVLRMPAAKQEFAVPIQGYYAGALSPAGRAAWQTLR